MSVVPLLCRIMAEPFSYIKNIILALNTHEASDSVSPAIASAVGYGSRESRLLCLEAIVYHFCRLLAVTIKVDCLNRSHANVLSWKFIQGFRLLVRPII